MRYKLNVFAREWWDSSKGKYLHTENYQLFDSALEKVGLKDYFYKRVSKDMDAWDMPDNCYFIRDRFYFKYKFSESTKFFAKIAELKNIPEIAKYYLILD